MPTSQFIINELKSAIRDNNKQRALELISPDDIDSLPDWDQEPERIWEEYDETLERALNHFNLG